MLGKQWLQTKEWYKGYFNFIRGGSFLLPQYEFDIFSKRILQRFKNVERVCCADRSYLNIPSVRFMVFLYLNLHPSQRELIDSNDKEGVITDLMRKVECHRSELLAMVDPSRRNAYWSEEAFAVHILDMGMRYIVAPSVEELTKWIKEFTADV